jgi:hypothetical protein
MALSVRALHWNLARVCQLCSALVSIVVGDVHSICLAMPCYCGQVRMSAGVFMNVNQRSPMHCANVVFISLTIVSYVSHIIQCFCPFLVVWPFMNACDGHVACEYPW